MRGGKYTSLRGMPADARLSPLTWTVGTSPATKAVHYREQAARIRELANAEQAGRFRDRLLEIASQYDELIAELSGD